MNVKHHALTGVYSGFLKYSHPGEIASWIVLDKDLKRSGLETITAGHGKGKLKYLCPQSLYANQDPSLQHLILARCSIFENVDSS